MNNWLTIALVLILIGCVLFLLTGCFSGFDFETIFNSKLKETTMNINESFRDISVNVSTADVLFLISEDDQCKIVANDKKNIEYNASVEDGVLLIKATDNRGWYERIFDYGAPSLSVYLTKNELGALNIDLSTGDVNLPEDFIFESIDINISTGDTNIYASANTFIKVNGSTGQVIMENMECGTLDVDISTGHTTLNNLICKEDIVLKASTGDMVLDGISCKSISSIANTGDITVKNLTASENGYFERSTGKIVLITALFTGNLTSKTNTGNQNFSDINCSADISTTVSTGKSTLVNVNCANFNSVGDTGDINMTNVIASGSFDIRRDTGDVDFDGCDASEITVSTDTGHVKGTLLTEKVFIARSDTGKTDVPETVSGGKCKITTETGDIKISVSQ